MRAKRIQITLHRPFLLFLALAAAVATATADSSEYGQMTGKWWTDPSESPLEFPRGTTCIEGTGDGVIYAAGRGWVAVRRLSRWRRRTVEGLGRATAITTLGDGNLWVSDRRGIVNLDSDLDVLSNTDMERREIRDIAVTDERHIWIASQHELAIYTGYKWKPCIREPLHRGDMRAAALDATGLLWVGTSFGVAIYDREGYIEVLDGDDGLPDEQVTSITLAGNGDVWIGSEGGLTRLRDGRYTFFSGRRWFPRRTTRVTSVAVDGEGQVWALSEHGVSVFRETPMTLARKAALLDWRLEERHVRDGYIAFTRYETPGDTSSPRHPEISDNDGLWTSLYVATAAYQYAVTKDPKVRTRGWRSCEALLNLERRSTIDGFPARASVPVDNPYGAIVRFNWHLSADGKWIWKGDTSTDELDGHYYAYALYYDLAATDDQKSQITAVVRRITDHMLANDYNLIDLDGQHTTWAVHSPFMLDGTWGFHRGLNSLEMLSHLKVAHHITGDEKYDREYQKLITKFRFHQNAITVRQLWPGEDNHSDDELIVLAFDPILRYETDPAIRRVILLGMEQTYNILKEKRGAWFNYIYQAATGRTADPHGSRLWLERLPMSQIRWGYDHRLREDVHVDPQWVEAGRPRLNRPLGPHETEWARWTSNPYQLGNGGGGTEEGDGVVFLLPYWMGRYHGWIE